jgi:replicative DNA helicase
MPIPPNVELPANIHAEKTIIGACLLDEAALTDATTLISPDDFYLDSHRRIYSVIAEMHSRGKAVDSITVSDLLTKRREMDAIGGPAYFADLTTGIPLRLNIESYVRIVKNAARARDLYKMTEAIGAAVLDKEDEPLVLLSQAKRWLEAIEGETGTDAPMESVAEYLDATYADEESIFDLDPREQGVPSGFPWQDDKTGGFIPGKLYIYAARTSMGKTAKVVNDVSNLALKAKVPTAVFTFEDSKHDFLQRLLCSRATANLTDLIKGRSDEGDRRAIKKAYADYREAPLYWDNSPKLTGTQIRAKLIRLNKSLPADRQIKVVFIDQLSFLSWEDVWEKGLRPDQLIGAVTRNLKRMGKELGMAVVLVCQLGRASTKNKDARPTLADLKDSGAIEENADVVIFFHRAEYYDRSNPALKGKGEHIIAKQRQGPVGSHTLRYLPVSVKWVDDWTPKDADDDEAPIPW